MSKSLLNFLVQISKVLINSKIKFLIQKSFFFTFGLATLTGPLGLRPSRPRWPLSSRRPKPTLPAHARCWRICKNMFSSLTHAFRSRRLLSIQPLTHGPHLSISSSPLRQPTPAVSPLRRHSPRRPLCASDDAEPLPPPSLPPLIPFKPSLNEP
jgi:hypothetical protein